MAQPARTQAPPDQPNEVPERRPRQLAVVRPIESDIATDLTAPTVGVHPIAVEIGLGAAIWFVLAMAFLFSSGDAFANYPLAIVVGFAVVFFGLTLGLSRRAAKDPRWADRPTPQFAEFLLDNVAIETGTISAREGLVQIITLPLVLAVGATVIGIVFVMSG